MKYIFVLLFGAFIGASVARPTETTPVSTPYTDGTEGSESLSSPLPGQQSSSSPLSGQESSSNPLPAQTCRCQLGSIHRKQQCREHPGGLDHSTVQGWSGRANWDCLPHVVEPNQGVCYRATVYTCDDEESAGIQCALKRRTSAFDESDKILLVQENPTSQSLILRSPRYGVKDYRNREFCIYNVNMFQCASGQLRIKSVQNHTYLYSDEDCNDYLELDFPDGYGLRRICGTDYFDIVLPATNFYAVFWTDNKHHSSGFEFSVTCVGNDSRDSSSST